MPLLFAYGINRFFMMWLNFKCVSFLCRRHNWKIFETAKAAKKASKDRLSTSSLGVADSGSQSMLGVSEESGAEMGSVSTRSSMYFSDGEGESGVSEGYGGDLESLYGYVLYVNQWLIQIYQFLGLTFIISHSSFFIQSHIK